MIRFVQARRGPVKTRAVNTAVGGRISRWVVRLLWRLRRPALKRRLRTVRLEWVDGVPLILLPAVHDPGVFRSGRLLLEATGRRPAGATGPRAQALDLGTGSGIGAIGCARAGYRVVATDVADMAVRCARINVLLNGLEDRIDVRRGDLFEPVRGERFDLVTFNPPFFRGTPTSPDDLHWRSPDVLERFATGLSDVLTREGAALVVFSDDADEPGFLGVLRAAALRTEPFVRRDWGNERMTVYLVTPER